MGVRKSNQIKPTTVVSIAMCDEANTFHTTTVRNRSPHPTPIQSTDQRRKKELIKRYNVVKITSLKEIKRHINS